MLAIPRVYGEGVNPCHLPNVCSSSRGHAKVGTAMVSGELNQETKPDRFCEAGQLPVLPAQRRNNNFGFWLRNTHSQEGLEPNLGLSREIEKLCTAKQLDRALELVVTAEQTGSFPAEGAYRSLFKACYRLIDVKKLQGHLVRCHLELSHPFGELLVVALLKCGGIQDALKLFHALPQRTFFSWSAVISHYADGGYGHEALELYHCMREEGVEPNEYTYVGLFKACGSIPDLERGRELHEDARARGFESSPFVGNTLVSMYGKCGRIIEAENVFFGMIERNLVSWNAMISAYVEQDEPENALQLYKQMREEGVNPNTRTSTVILQAACLLAQKESATSVDGKLMKLSSLETVYKVHVDVQLMSIDADGYVGNALVKAYGKCGSVGEAQTIFRGMPERDVVTWNTLLSVYVEHGHSEKALRLYRQMEGEGVVPDERTFVNVAQACCTYSQKEGMVEMQGQEKKSMSLDVGQGLHADAKKMGFASNIFLCNTLITLYGKCWSLGKAENVFTGMVQHDIVSWTALLSAYVEQGEAKKALLLYGRICEEGMSLDERTVAIALQACCFLTETEEAILQEGRSIKVMCLEIGQALHLDSKKMKLASDPFVTSGLVTLYGKCECLIEAEMAFNGSFPHGVVAWNVMLSTYNEQGEAERALELYRQMQKEGVNPDERTVVIAIQSCCMLADIEAAVALKDGSTKAILLEIGRSLHADARKRGLHLDAFVRSALVSLYGKCGSINEAENVVALLPELDIMVWNAMLLAYTEVGEAKKTLQLYGHLIKEGVCVAEKGTYVIALQAVCALAEKEKSGYTKTGLAKMLYLTIGKKLHAIIRGKGYDLDLFVGTTLLSMYGKCKSIVEAEALFKELPKKNVVTWNTMLSAYIEQGQGERALDLYKAMQVEGVALDDITLLCLLRVCSLSESKDMCWHIHFTIVSAGYDTSLPLTTTLINAYGNCALTADAQAIFSKLSSPDAVSWSALIAGYARERNADASFTTFEKMQEAKVQPTGLTFLCLLLACTHAGLVDKGIAFFESMSRDYGLVPELEHYITLVELLGRAGDFGRLRDILDGLPAQPDPAFWIGLLSACQKHGIAELEKLVVVRAERIQRSHPKSYRLLLSMCGREPFQVNEPAEGLGDEEMEELYISDK